jgi:hypothetical protein
MGALTGTWYIYSQPVGDNSVFTTPDFEITIDVNDETSDFDPIAGKDEVAFTRAGASQYYLGSSTRYSYRAQVLEDSGLKLLIGHISTPEGVALPKCCVFAGLLAEKVSTPDPTKMDFLKVLHIPLFYDNTKEHKPGEVHIDGSNPVLLKEAGAADLSFGDTTRDHRSDGIYLKAKRRVGGNNELKGRIIFASSSRPIFIGYHWSPSVYLHGEDPYLSIADGAPTDKRCTNGLIGC